MTSQTFESTSFQALYTKQKTQKHKKWKDGRLQVEYDERHSTCKSRVKLFDEDGLLIMTSLLHSQSVDTGKDLEMEQYLVQVLEPEHNEGIAGTQEHRQCEEKPNIRETDQNAFKKRKRTVTNVRSQPTHFTSHLGDENIESQVNYSGRTTEDIIRLLFE